MRNAITDPAIRFDRRVNKTETCWLWTGRLRPNGYAEFQSGSGWCAKKSLVHRWNYERLVGPIPEGWQVDHLCKVRHCVNPDHLEAVPPAINNARSNSPSAIKARMVMCGRGLHELTGDNLHPTYLRHGVRCCRSCHAQYQREYRARKRAEREGTSQ